MTKVLVPIAAGCEELEAVTIIDLLRRAGIEVVVAGLEDGAVTASRGVVLMPDTTLQQALAEEYDMLVLPGGGPGTERLEADERIRDLLVKMSRAGKFVAAICAAPKVLDSAGLLQDKQVTCYPDTLDRQQVPGLDTRRSVVQDGNIITSRGPGTAMDFALSLIEQLTDKQNRDAVEAGLAR